MSNPRPSKIIRIIARLNVGGPAKHVVWLTDGLKNTHETLLVAGTVPAGEGDMSYFAEQLQVVPHIIPEMSREISLKDVVTIWKLYRLFLREQPDVVHTHTAKAGTVGRVAGFIYRWLTPGSIIGRPRECKFVHTYHGHIFHSYYGHLKTRVFINIEKLLAALVTDRVVVISEQQAFEICDTFGVGKRKQIKVIPLGLDLGLFDGSNDRRQRFREELEIDDQTILVGIVGRLTEIKNHELFLNVVSKFNQLRSVDDARVRFVILGDGHLRTSLESQSRSLGLENDVIFAGERNDPEYFYPALDIVALTSRNEGTPLTLIEAMANARAVIATNVGGVADLLGEVRDSQEYKVCERGIGVSPGDVDGFASGLARLVDDRELRNSVATRGFEFVLHKYPKQRLLDDIRGLYDELLNPEPGDFRQVSQVRPIGDKSSKAL
jgi:glycosyltransferase involved in cell wall biosynthesis